MNTIQLSPSVLDWAASQVGQTLHEIAYKISKASAEKILGGVLTNAQAVKFSKVAHIPLGYLFLEEPPPERLLPVADFRTLPSSSPLGVDFFQTFDDIEFKQAWYREFVESSGADPIPFVGKYKKQRPIPKVCADDIRAQIRFFESDLRELNSPDDLFSVLVSKCEAVGILVFKNGVVGNNTHRPLSVSEFRGFALADQFAPVVFVNGADASAAWAFTLAHELAHIWLGDSGVSDADPSSDSAIERYCNAVAAEVLVPASSFLNKWNSIDESNVFTKLDSVRSLFKVSGLVIARRALDLGVIDKNTYWSIYSENRQARKNKSSGGDFYRTLATRNSKKFSGLVSNLAMSGRITLGQAGRLLNTNPNHVVKFYAKQN